MRYVVLEKENDQQDDQDQQENATTDVHLQPPWSQVPRLDTRSVQEINPRVRRTTFAAIPNALGIPETTEEA